MESRTRRFKPQRLPHVGLRQILRSSSIECRDVVRFATGNESVVHNDFLIDPLCACVAHVDLNCWPRSHLSAANKIRADQDLWSMTYDRHRFVLPEKMLRKPKCVLI